MKDFSEKLHNLPLLPGVYIMRDESGTILYVGKAKKLKNRVSSYFNGFKSQPRKTQRLVTLIDDFEYIITANEKEALILEGTLIKKHMPRFNILLKDDKTFPYVKITNEKYPRVVKTREVKKGGSEYFGPYTRVFALNKALEVIKRIYPIRKCSRNMSKTYKKPCLYYHMGMCLGPCIDKTKASEYQAALDGVKTFLKRGSSDVLTLLETEMLQASKDLKFERAAMLRDEISSIKELNEKQSVASLSESEMDVIACAKNDKAALVVMFFVRGGILNGREKYVIYGAEDSEYSEIIEQFVLQYYSGTPYIPKMIELMVDIDLKEVHEAGLSDKKGEKVVIHVPKRGEKKRLVDLAAENAREILEKDEKEQLEKKLKRENLLNSLKDLLSLPKIPNRIELYDISNIMGVYSVGAMVVYEKGDKKKSDYRKFKIKTEGKIDDYSAIMEVLYRRHRRSKDAGFETLADLIIIDGGKGHVGVAEEVISALNLDVKVAGLVKDDHHRTRAIFYSGREYPIDKHTGLYSFLAGMQEEVHRFAIGYHRQIRSKGMLTSVLDDISGVGDKRKAALLRKFGSIERVGEASYADLIEIPEINSQVAEKIVEYFKEDD